jgi:hypothetical protein
MTFSFRKRFLPLLLATTILTGCISSRKAVSRSPATPVTTTTAIDSVLEAEIQRQLCLSNDKYTYEQATVRAIANRDGEFNYPGRNNGKLSTLFSSYAQTDYSPAQVPDTARTLWQNMQDMRNSLTVIGPMLADFSVKASIFYGYADMKGTVGLWYDYDGTVKVGNDNNNSQDERLLTQAHETIHAIQRTTEVRDQYLAWSLKDFQMSCVASEAAAEAGSHLLALEMKLDCIDGPWNILEKENSTRAAQLLLNYNTAIASNTPYAQALAAAGKADFYAQFKKQWWLDFYNDRMLKRYINLMVDSTLHKPSEMEYTLETARKTGYISPEFSFTAGLDSLPSSQTLYGKNTRMQQASAYVELERLGYTLGRQDSLYLKTLAQLEKDKNPYLGVDLKLVDSTCKKGGFGALVMMTAFADLLKKAAPVPVKNKSKMHKP